MSGLGKKRAERGNDVQLMEKRRRDFWEGKVRGR
jgi:hypothetical protein